jgi:hypothetical protein
MKGDVRGKTQLCTYIFLEFEAFIDSAKICLEC